MSIPADNTPQMGEALELPTVRNKRERHLAWFLFLLGIGLMLMLSWVAHPNRDGAISLPPPVERHEPQ